MPALFIFLFKVNVALLLFCLGYYLVLRHLTFYTLNRVYLVTAIIFSTLYPAINLSGFAERHQKLTEPVQAVIINWKIPAEKLVQPDYWQWVGVVFWTGVVLFAARLVMQLLSLYKLYRQSKPGNVESHYVRLINGEVSPFSFWRNIYINPSKLSPSELKSVLEHEQVHVSEWHTLDILLAELSTIFYWFNPGVWLMKKAVRENIEFITDRKILQKGMDSKEYQYSLVSVGLAAPANAIVNHFNMSTIKKRIIMMNTKKSPGYKVTRYLFLVPAVVVLLLTFSLSKAEVAKHTIKSIAHIVSNTNIVDEAKQVLHQAASKKIMLNNTTTHVKNNPADTVYAGKTKDGNKSFLMTSDQKADSLIYVINGEKSSKEEVKALDPAKIQSLEMLPPASGKEFFPDADGKHHVLFVTTEDSERGKELKARIDKSFSGGKLAMIKNIHIESDSDSDVAPSSSAGTAVAYSISSDDKSPVIVGETNNDVNRNINTVTIVGIDPKVKGHVLAKVQKSYNISGNISVSTDIAPEAHVESFNVVTADAKPAKVFVRGFNSNNDQLTIDGKANPLYIIDGKETRTIKNIAAEDIKSITILKDGTATKKYGEKGKNGVVEIMTQRKN